MVVSGDLSYCLLGVMSWALTLISVTARGGGAGACTRQVCGVGVFCKLNVEKSSIPLFIPMRWD